MKLYVRSAETLDELEKIVKDRLKVSGVRSVNIKDMNSRYMSVNLIYDDGSSSETFQVRFENKPSRKNSETDWNPDWNIRDDGAVLDKNGLVVGWFKLAKRRPKSTTPNYLEDSLTVDYGTRKIKLTEGSGSAVAKAVR